MKNVIHKPDATGLLHSVRNVLGIISGNASLLELSTNLSEAERDQVKMISSAVFEISEQLHQLARAIEVAPPNQHKRLAPTNKGHGCRHNCHELNIRR